MTTSSTAAQVRRYARQLARAYARVLAERYDDDDALDAVRPYLARCLRAAWPLSAGNMLRGEVHRVLCAHAQLVRTPRESAQRIDARDQLAAAIRDLERLCTRPLR